MFRDYLNIRDRSRFVNIAGDSSEWDGKAVLGKIQQRHFHPELKPGAETTRRPRVRKPEGLGSGIRDKTTCDVEWGQGFVSKSENLESNAVRSLAAWIWKSWR